MILKRKMILSLLVSLVVIAASVTSVFADDNRGHTDQVNTPKYFEDVYPAETDYISDDMQSNGQFKDVYYTKKDVTITHEWSTAKRVSDDVKAGSKGGSITASREVTFSGSTSGSIFGITISGAMSITSSDTYTLNLEPNKTQYMVYQVYYKIESGTRETRDMMTTKVESTNKYTVKTIDHGRYSLVTVK